MEWLYTHELALFLYGITCIQSIQKTQQVLVRRRSFEDFSRHFATLEVEQLLEILEHTSPPGALSKGHDVPREECPWSSVASRDFASQALKDMKSCEIRL